VLRLIFNRWVLGAVCMLAIALLIWWVGPTISIHNFYPLESEWARWLHIAVVLLVPIVRLGWDIHRSRKGNSELMSGLLRLIPSKGETPADPGAGEVAQLRKRFEDALALLRKLRFGGERTSLWARLRSLGSQQYLYDLPWYVFIGAPGAGKTTALVNSGLRFPLADRLGRDAVRGVGGTRDCDWWFTDEAVFLDTAGRYSTQQSNRELDASAWKGFLHLLKKARPRRPVNGVFLTVSVADLLQESAAERDAHTQALRARVQEIYHELGVRLPIYVLVTKGDLLAGFTEFFASLGKEERAQVWGFSLPYAKRAADPGTLSAELSELERRLYERLPDRLNEEADAARRALLYGFPQQFSILREQVVQFVEATFSATQFETPPLLRGVYLTSGTQEGSPVDRVLGAVARGLGLERKVLPAQHPTGRSYFLTALLRNVVFAEAGLAGLDLRWERRRAWLAGLVAVGATAASILIALAWWISYRHNRDYLAEVTKQQVNVQKQVAIVRAGVTSDLSALLPTLASVRTLAETRATPDGSVPWSWRFGLYQGGKLEAASRAAYQRMLQETFLPSLTAYLESYLRQGASGSQEEVYQALKTYVMLYDPKHFNREGVWRWYQTRGDQLVRGGPDAQQALAGQFDALYERGWVEPSIPRNDALVDRVRLLVVRDALPNRIYDRIRREPVTDVRDFVIAEKGGSKAMLVFERASREPLTKGVPALYTKDGYYRHVMHQVDLSTAQLAEEQTWVLGAGGGAASATVASVAIADAVKRLYLEDYRRTWQRFIADIGVVRERDLVKTIEITRTLSAQDTPLRTLLKAIDRETMLSVPPEADPGLVGTVAGKAQQYAGKARQVVGGAAPSSLEKALVDDQFDDLHRFVNGPEGKPPAPMDTVIGQLNDFYLMLVSAKSAIDGGQPPPPPDATNKLRAEAGRQPEPMRGMLQGLVEGGSRQLVTQTREKQYAEMRQVRDRTDAELRAQLGDYCAKAVSGRYPFVRTSIQDVTPEDFARLFAPNGVLDGFFQKFLAQYVDTSQKPWRFKDPALGQSAALAEFQRAQVIRDVFFRGGGSQPSIQLEFRPVQMDATIQQFLLDVDGRLIRYAHGPQVTTRVQFPGPGGRSQVRLSIAPPPPSGTSGITYDGPWALFRMFDSVQIQDTGQAERFLTTFEVEGRRTTFEIFASSVRNPFRLPELSQFRCPSAL
jgi:type VI secretion system protein ImpL